MLPFIIALSNLIFKPILMDTNKKIDVNFHINLLLLLLLIYMIIVRIRIFSSVKPFQQKFLSNLSYPFLGRMYLLQMHDGFLLYITCLRKVKEIVNLRSAKNKDLFFILHSSNTSSTECATSQPST